MGPNDTAGFYPGALPAASEPVFLKRDGELYVEGVALDEIAESAGTPVYVYSAAGIRAAVRSFEEAFAGERVSICYAAKANGNLSVLSLLSGLGCGVDIVSGGELERALAAGVPAARIVFSGVGKTRAEIAAALRVGIGQFNVESAGEIELVASIAGEQGARAPIALRVNPDVDAMTHDKISTGRRGDKFGLPLGDIPSLYEKAAGNPDLDVVGLAMHLGSQITDLRPYGIGYGRLGELVQMLRGRGLAVQRLDLGGGIGISYGSTPAPQLDEYASVIRESVGNLAVELTIEPGRRIVGDAGVLLAEVLYVKPDGDRDIVVVDAGMNDLVRPALYGAVHPIRLLVSRQGPCRPCRIVGPVCESGDSFGAYETSLPALLPGDRIAFMAAGAYGASMASTYNARPLVPEVMVDGGHWRIVRRRQTVEEMIALERPSDELRESGRASSRQGN